MDAKPLNKVKVHINGSWVLSVTNKQNLMLQHIRTYNKKQVSIGATRDSQNLYEEIQQILARHSM